MLRYFLKKEERKKNTDDELETGKDMVNYEESG